MRVRGVQHNQAFLKAVEGRVLASMGAPTGHLLGTATRHEIESFYFDLAQQQYCLNNGKPLNATGVAVFGCSKGRRLRWGLAVGGKYGQKIAIKAKRNIAKQVLQHSSNTMGKCNRQA